MSLLDATGLTARKISDDIPLPDDAVGALRVDQAHLIAASVSSGPPNAQLLVSSCSDSPRRSRNLGNVPRNLGNVHEEVARARSSLEDFQRIGPPPDPQLGINEEDSLQKVDDVPASIGIPSAPLVGLDHIARSGNVACYPEVINQVEATVQNEGIPSSQELEREKLDELGCCQASALFVEPVVVAAQNSSDCRPSLPIRDFQKDGVLLPQILPTDCGAIGRPEGEGDPPAGENRDLDCDFDVVSSQSSKDWSTEEIAKDPMRFVLQSNAVSNTDQSVLDVGAQFVTDQAAGSPHRPGVDGVAISDECGLIPEVDGATPESIARIARKYSLAEVVDGLLNKAPFELQDVRPIPLSGCPVKGSEASVDEDVQFYDSGCGLVHALPKVNPCAGNPLAHAIPSITSVSGKVAAVQGLSPCNPRSVDPAGRAIRIDPSVDPSVGGPVYSADRDLRSKSKI
ncbi:hypothetical protein Nepgr_006803 [Nepenthes gracilis]|uniref:Uncharacterized protein n=1 Tax=Nepenthes gracilis TaxID=150966 RepID=A0AAD3XHP9_NEPGR|nr:hypothetical protein Nepgr_006803 [Nepenthes gracilis]